MLTKNKSGDVLVVEARDIIDHVKRVVSYERVLTAGSVEVTLSWYLYELGLLNMSKKPLPPKDLRDILFCNTITTGIYRIYHKIVDKHRQEMPEQIRVKGGVLIYFIWR